MVVILLRLPPFCHSVESPFCGRQRAIGVLVSICLVVGQRLPFLVTLVVIVEELSMLGCMMMRQRVHACKLLNLVVRVELLFLMQRSNRAADRVLHPRSLAFIGRPP